MMSRTLAAVLLVLPAALSLAQGLADEDRDWGVAPQAVLRPSPYTAPTPLEVPGARRVRTEELGRSLTGAGKPILIDVASGEGHLTLAEAHWWPGAGHGANFVDAIQGELAMRLAQATGGDKAAPLAFFCVNAQCWLSYNASLRAVALGYTRVLWYRGGVEAWRAAGLPLGRVREPWAAAGPLESGGEPGKAR
jgi:PQQ-dependent catabolism-associated CXXCW motif protein